MVILPFEKRRPPLQVFPKKYPSCPNLKFTR